MFASSFTWWENKPWEIRVEPWSGKQLVSASFDRLQRSCAGYSVVIVQKKKPKVNLGSWNSSRFGSVTTKRRADSLGILPR
jgi:hypothetical protein